MSSFSRPAVVTLSATLLLQAGFIHWMSRVESQPPMRPLAELPVETGGWTMLSEGVVEEPIQEVLHADDTLVRLYRNPEWAVDASLFIAYFASQRTGQAPHSPKNCLPGSGWVPMESGRLDLSVDGVAAPIQVNRYVVAKGDNRSLTLYWYQSHDRVIASEYWAKFYLVADSIRYNRSDTALVRVVVPMNREDADTAVSAARDFVRAFFPSLRRHLSR